jgi:EAL domain-containing protein (putative c-di-GMP-specific phosphodiesterase class I)
MIGARARTDARILVIDDEAQNLALVDGMLRAAGYRQVELVQHSAEALDRFLSLQPDIILLDLHMPPPDGFAVMEAVRRHTDPDDFLPILVLSADVNQQVRERALAEGASDLVGKPLQLAEVLLRIGNLLERRGRHRDLRASHDTAAAELARRHEVEQAETDRLDKIRRRIETVLVDGGPPVVFQPIVELPPVAGAEGASVVVDLRGPRGDSATATVGLEALARFKGEPRQGPDRWFHDAAEVRMALELELAAVRAGLAALDRLPSDLWVSVNASWATIVSEPFHDLVAGFDGGRVVIELTEHERVGDYAQLDEAVERLHGLGMRLAIDDAGAGFASLEHILRLGPDIVKIDRSLVTRVDTDPIRRSMIAAFVHFGEETGISLIAEGVEEVGELDTLHRLGVRQAQGYHLAMPADLDTTMALVPGC